MHSNVMPPEISGPSGGIPEATVARLPVYLRALYGLAERGISTVASEELAAAAGVNSAKLRKDLSHLGSYGIRGVGYDVDYLVYQVSRTLGLTQDWPVVIVGAGNLGRALANYGGFVSRGFTIAAMLDSDPAIVGSKIARLTVRHVDELEAAGGPAQGRDRRDRRPGRVRAGRLRPAGRGGRDQHPQFRSARAERAGGGRRAEGRPVDRAADPRLPRPAQVGRGPSRPGRGRPGAVNGTPRPLGDTGDLRTRGAGLGGEPVSVLVVGLSHKSAPVAILEQAAVSGDTLAKLLRDVALAESVAETFVVSTCNRVEVYADVDRFHAGVTAICELLARHCGVQARDLTPHLYVHYEDRAVAHLLAVACGLDSVVVGEGQILGQVRSALKLAEEHGTVGRVLGELGRLALRAGKRARTETGIDRAGHSLVSVAVELAAARLGRHRARTAGSWPGGMCSSSGPAR